MSFTLAGLSLVEQCQVMGLPIPEREVRFHPVRKWRADYLWRTELVICELDGGVFKGGRHTRGVGYEEDCLKLAEALILGYRVLRVTPRMVKTGRALHYLTHLLRGGR